MIKLQIIGNLGKDCIQKEVNGKNVINFTVAHHEKFKDAQGNPKERTTWVECAYWTDRIGIVPYLKKGQLVFAEGSPEADAYTNKENQPAATLRMRVREVQLLGGRNESSPTQQSSGSYSSSQPAQHSAPVSMSQMADAPDDLPF